jgi:O-antigen ligase
MPVAGALSHLSHGYIGGAMGGSIELLKSVVYYLILIVLVDTPARLMSMLTWTVRFTTLLTILALLHYHGAINIPALDAYQEGDIDPVTGEHYLIPRLRSTGLFNDPNDLSMILVVSIIVSLAFLTQQRSRIRQVLELVPLGIFLYALKLTYSRGGLINLGFALLILSYAKFGWRKTVLAAVLCFPALLLIFGGRQTRIDLDKADDTSQCRIQAWAEGLELFRQYPFFGIGMEEYHEHVGLVAHNSFVHAYTETGLFGGTLFTGAFYSALLGISRVHRDYSKIREPILLQLQPFIFAIIVSYCVGMLSLTRNYSTITYVILGIGAAYCHIAESRAALFNFKLDLRFVQRLAVVGVAWLAVLLIFVRTMVRWQ